MNQNIPASNESHSEIHLVKPEDIQYWTNTFKITEEILREAIHEVGNNPKEVTVYLCQKRIQTEKSQKTEHG